MGARALPGIEAGGRNDSTTNCSALPRLLNKVLQHHLAPGLVEIDRQLDAVDADDDSGAKLDVKDARPLGQSGFDMRSGARPALDHRRPIAKSGHRPLGETSA